jgi:calcium binding protein 39
MLRTSYNVRCQLQELLTRHKMLGAEFLEANYDKVFGHYQRLLNSENYVTRRQSLKLLGELLLDRHNFSVNIAYMCVECCLTILL